ncbi:MAG: MBL fold metallo-hydrolase [candidate division Zixibacteria bacterium]|nr:MBL fold metallo-hydrolase [candidate division Zixibacteria bacterium]
MILKTLIVGELETNCYILGDEKTREGIIIDPGGDLKEIEKVLEELHLEIKYIILTHGHSDHIGVLAELKKKTCAQILIHKEDAEMLSEPEKNLSIFSSTPISAPEADKLLKDKDKIKIGNIELEVLHTPGHTQGSISLWTDKIIFTGDLIFYGSVGRTDLPGGSYQKLLRSIQEKILDKEEDMIIYSGHGPATTVGEERRNNPFLNL